MSTSGQSQSVEAFMALQINANILTITHTACATFHTHTNTHTNTQKRELRQACIWYTHRTTHFVGYLFWSYAHLALASQIECGSNEKLRERDTDKDREGERKRDKGETAKGKRLQTNRKVRKNQAKTQAQRKANK